jgi:hypothetical protein
MKIIVDERMTAKILGAAVSLVILIEGATARMAG